MKDEHPSSNFQPHHPLPYSPSQLPPTIHPTLETPLLTSSHCLSPSGPGGAQSSWSHFPMKDTKTSSGCLLLGSPQTRLSFPASPGSPQSSPSHYRLGHSGLGRNWTRLLELLPLLISNSRVFYNLPAGGSGSFSLLKFSLLSAFGTSHMAGSVNHASLRPCLLSSFPDPCSLSLSQHELHPCVLVKHAVASVGVYISLG